MSGALLHAVLVKLGFAVSVTVGNRTSTDEDGQTVTGTFRMNTDGTWTYTGDFLGSNANGSWGSPTTPSIGDGFHCRLVFISGTNHYLSGAALNTWLPLTSNVAWNFRKLSSGGPDEDNGVFRIDVSDDGGSTTLDSDSFNIRLNEQSP